MKEMLDRDGMLNPETYRLLQEQDWGAIGKELLAFAIYRARNYYWRRGVGKELAAGKTAEDIVQDVIVKTIEGTRRWDPEKGALLPWLKDQVKSEIDHLCHSLPHIYEAPFPESEGREDQPASSEYYASLQDRPGTTLVRDPEDMILKKEEIEQRENALFQAAYGDRELEDLLSASYNCEPKPRYIAAELGVPGKDIYRLIRRLRRRALKLLEGDNG
jgi:DNA-directed RNA polymerase specialized sigma24 family protein